MRIILSLLMLFSVTSFADELELAYQKEYAYLIAEKKALQERVVSIKKDNQRQLNSIQKEIDELQKAYLGKKNRVDQLNREIVEASRVSDHVENDVLLIDTTLAQAKESLKKLGLTPNEKSSAISQLDEAMSFANVVLKNDETTQETTGKFYLENGEEVSGDIVKVGRVARYGTAGNVTGALAPAGSGKFKVWKSENENRNPLTTSENNPVEIFLYESTEKAFEQKEEQKLEDDIEAGGPVGLVIIGLGLVGLVLVIIRTLMLVWFSSDVNKITAKVNKKIKEEGVDSAIATCEKYKCSTSKVIAKTLKNINKARDHVEDIISESILHESSRIDKFGTFIIVIAAVSPLLGLLGTVTGMISTFDIITEYGTGDPKLLSSGISEALVTTKFGLIVAIPMLLLGNTLSSWAFRIKSDLEQAALHMLNAYKH